MKEVFNHNLGIKDNTTQERENASSMVLLFGSLAEHDTYSSNLLVCLSRAKHRAK